MNFHIELFSTTTGWALNESSRDAGLNGLDLAREKEGCPALSPERVDWQISARREDPVIEITEEIARRSGLFKERNLVKVAVREGDLNQFLYRDIKASRSQETGEVHKCWIIQRLDRAKVVEWWEKAGFPTTDE